MYSVTQAVFIPLYSNFVLWLFTHLTCTPYTYAHLILYFWMFNLEIFKSSTVDYIVYFGCNLISFLYIWTLHIDCSHTDVHRRRRSRAEFGLVIYINTYYFWEVIQHYKAEKEEERLIYNRCPPGIDPGQLVPKSKALTTRPRGQIVRRPN